MMLEVDILTLNDDGDDEMVGTIAYDGEFHLTPDNDEMLAYLEIPLWEADGGEVYSGDDPERFMRGLVNHYKSAYCRATEARGDI